MSGCFFSKPPKNSQVSVVPKGESTEAYDEVAIPRKGRPKKGQVGHRGGKQSQFVAGLLVGSTDWAKWLWLRNMY